MDKLINELLLLTKIEDAPNIQEKKIFDVSKEVEIRKSVKFNERCWIIRRTC